MTEQFIPLATIEDFDQFWMDNHVSLLEIASYEECFALACNCELIIGGGAAPLFRVGFVD
jgi:hypothetical protein